MADKHKFPKRSKHLLKRSSAKSALQDLKTKNKAKAQIMPALSARDFVGSRNLAAPPRLGELGARLKEWKLQRDAHFVLEDIRKHNIFFYPGAGIDWAPLSHLIQFCDTFIFSDWGISEDVFTGNFHPPAGLEEDFRINVDAHTIGYLSDDSLIPAVIKRIIAGIPHHNHVKPWGKYARLSRRVGKTNQHVHFFYFGIEGITSFFNLFVPTRVAPKIICLRFGMDHNHEGFGWPHGGLGQVVGFCESEPKHLVCDSQSPTWPYTVLSKKLGNWSSMWKRQS